MSERTGTTISCDRYECDSTAYGKAEDEARADARERGWERTEDGRDFCRQCVEIRARRKKVADLVPKGVRLLTPFEAAEAAGFEKRDYDEKEGVAHFYCCGTEVDVSALIGTPYGARCTICANAIADVLGPSFGNGHVAMADPDKVDTEDPRSWVVVKEYEALCSTERTP